MTARPPLGDALLASGLLAWALVEIVTGTVDGPPVVTVGAALLGTASLAWRRSFPVTTALVCAGGLVLKTACGLRLDGLALLCAILVAAYTLGRHLPPGRATWTAAAVVVLAWLSLFGLPEADRTLANYPFVLLWVCGPALAGAALRHQVERAAAAADRAARAEIAREQHARAAVAEERARIARELHDTVAHAVSVMVLHAGAVRSRLPEELRSEREGLTRTEDAGRHAIGELHRMLGVLRDQHGEPDQGTLAAPPTLAHLDDLLEASRRTGLAVHLTIEGEPPDLTGSGRAVDLSAYRILQEALTNVRKHARATTVWVRIAYGDGGIRLRVVDDGVGTVDGVRSGHGLVGIRERVEVFGGELRVTSPRGGGYQLEVALPGGSR